MAASDFRQRTTSRFHNESSVPRAPPFHAGAQPEHPLRGWPGGLIEFYGHDEGGGSCMLAAAPVPRTSWPPLQAAGNHDMRVITTRMAVELPFGEVGEVGRPLPGN